MTELPSDFGKKLNQRLSDRGFKTGFDDMERCKLSDIRKEKIRLKFSSDPESTYINEPMPFEEYMDCGVAKVKISALLSTINSKELNAQKLENAICDVAMNLAKMPFIKFDDEVVGIEQGRHRITAMGKLGYMFTHVNYSLKYELVIRNFFGQDFITIPPESELVKNAPKRSTAE